MKNYSLNHADLEASAAEVTVLDNGLRIVTVQRPVQTVVVSVFANVGARFETEQENGLSHFLEHMAFKGTTTRSALDITFEIERLGANVNAFTSRSMTAYFVVGLLDHVGPSLDILSDVIKNSVMSPDEIVREQGVVVQEIYESQDDIDDIAMDALSATAYPNQALGRPILGSEENVRSFDQATVIDYLRRHCHSGGLIIMATGDVDHAEFVAEATARFGDIETGVSPVPVAAQYVGGTSVSIDDRYSQAHILVGFPAAGSVADDFARFDLLSDILGSGMSSPLFQEVREKAGLCYSVGAAMLPQADHSLFVLTGATSAENVEAFVTKSLAELVRIANGDITDADWERARNQITRQIVSMSENGMLLSRQAASQLFTLGHTRTLASTKAKYMSLTREDIIATAKELIASKPTVVVVGNAPKADYETLVSAALSA